MPSPKKSPKKSPTSDKAAARRAMLKKLALGAAGVTALGGAAAGAYRYAYPKQRTTYQQMGNFATSAGRYASKQTAGGIGKAYRGVNGLAGGRVSGAARRVNGLTGGRLSGAARRAGILPQKKSIFTTVMINGVPATLAFVEDKASKAKKAVGSAASKAKKFVMEKRRTAAGV